MKLLQLIWLLIPGVVFAQETVNSPKALNTGSIMQTLLGLLLVLALIAAMAWLLKRSQQFHGSGQGSFRVVAAIALGPREKAVLVQVGEQQLLLGVTNQQVNLIHTLPEPLQLGNKPITSSAFGEKLKQMMQQQRNA